MLALKEMVVEQLQGVQTRYAKDFNALSHEQLNAPPMGAARTAYDFTYECAVVNDRIAARLRGEDPGPWPAEGWMVAPEEFRNKEVAGDKLAASVTAMIEAWNAVPEEETRKVLELPSGNTTPLDMIMMAIMHLSHHDGQLNYLQQLHGDMEMHWM